MKTVAALLAAAVFASGCTGVEFTPPPTTQDVVAEAAFLAALRARGPGWRDFPDSQLLFDGYRWCAMVGSSGWEDTVQSYYDAALVEMGGDAQGAEVITMVVTTLGSEAIQKLCPLYLGELP